jgi:hypothetical protein
MTNKYDDIINLPHHVSPTRQQMPMSDRAAQFSPFAALTGYEDVISETARLTDKKIELNEEALNILNIKFQALTEKLKNEPDVTFTYFKPDERKDGGAFIKIKGKVKKIDCFERLITMKDGTKLLMDNIIDIEAE